MTPRLTFSILWMACVHLQMQLSVGRSLSSSGTGREDSCPVDGSFVIIGQIRLPNCGSKITCRHDSDCPEDYTCHCSNDCGRICKIHCPIRPKSEFRVFGVMVSVCKSFQGRGCTDSTECTSFSMNGVTMNCICSGLCGSVCQAEPIPTLVPQTHAGLCPAVFAKYRFPFCLDKCRIDAHCQAPDLKCCDTFCGKRCKTAVLPPTMTGNIISTSTLTLNTAQADGTGTENAFTVSDVYENATELTTDVTTDYVEITNATIDENVDITNDNETTVTEKIFQGAYASVPPQCDSHRSLNYNSSYQCIRRVHQPVCASNGITYRNECYLRRAQKRLDSTLTIIYRGPCRHGWNADPKLRTRRNWRCIEQNCGWQKRLESPNRTGVSAGGSEPYENTATPQ